jgi:uncharacterized protein
MHRFFLAFLMFVVVGPMQALAQDAAAPPRTISTSGEALIHVPPDEVIINVGIETFDLDLDKAKAANRQAAERMLKAVRAMGIEEKRIQTANLELEIRYRSREPHTQIEGYMARRAYAITLKDPRQFEEVVDTALKNGANRLMGFQFLTSELRKHRDEARKMAVGAAREKAIALAGELDCRIGSPRTINESGGHFGHSGLSSGWNRYSMMSQNTMQVAGDPGEGGQTLPLGHIGIRASVTVTFDLLP